MVRGAHGYLHTDTTQICQFHIICPSESLTDSIPLAPVGGILITLKYKYPLNIPRFSKIGASPIVNWAEAHFLPVSSSIYGEVI